MWVLGPLGKWKLLQLLLEVKKELLQGMHSSATPGLLYLEAHWTFLEAQVPI